MNHDLSRKTFFTKLAGLIAVIGVAPKILVTRTTAATRETAPMNPSFQIRPEPRAVARDGASL